MKRMRLAPGGILLEAICALGCIGCGAEVDIECAGRDPFYFLCPKCREQWRRELRLRRDEASGILSCGVYAPKSESLSKRLVLQMKEDERYALAAFAAGELRKTVGAFLGQLPADAVILYAPRRKKAVRKLGFDHMRYVAKELARQSGAVTVTAFENRGGEAQKRLNREERADNVAGGLRLTKHAAEKLTGRTAVIVDDITTTGATLQACRKLALEGGAAQVICVAMLRTEE